MIFRSVGQAIVHPSIALNQLAISDVSEAQLFTAAEFLDSIYGDGHSGRNSRAQTPMVSTNYTNHSTNHNTQAPPLPAPPPPSWGSYRSLLGLSTILSPSRHKTSPNKESIRSVTGLGRITRSVTKLRNPEIKEPSALIYAPNPTSTSSSRKTVPSMATLPQSPNVDHVSVSIDEQCEYAIVVSLYEVYNDKIFDLLAESKSMPKEKRRQLLFKNTGYSADRKVVTGLRKIVCGSLEEALLIMETGLLERRVTGTGSNAVSSRSHGFFCIDVKRRKKGSNFPWGGNSFTIVDLAGMHIVYGNTRQIVADDRNLGSERARTANTAGATLAEAGKINESLMYLGQCMQIQSDISNGIADASKVVPFRQCKLTELLFSNAFCSNSNTSSSQAGRTYQQKAIMIVTADPRGDFNATSQILRYSALAREVTVPRIPSVTSTILSGPQNAISISSTTMSASTRPHGPCTACGAKDLELASLKTDLAAQAEQHAVALEELELKVRAECWDAFSLELEKERARWANAWEEERERVEGHVDEKVDVLVRGLGVDDEQSGSSNDGFEELQEKLLKAERDNEILRAKLKALEREKKEVGARTPSRKLKVLKARPWGAEMEVDENAMP